MLYSYVVEHDRGHAPNPGYGYCTLAHCKYQHSKRRRNLVEMAIEDNWIVGTGGSNPLKSAGNGKLIYLMQVTEKLPLEEYWRDKRFREKRPVPDQKFPGDNIKAKIGKGRFVLISDHFWYFGENAPMLPPALAKKIEKRGPNYRSRSIEPEAVQQLIDWVSKRFPKPGVYGDPCQKSEPAHPLTSKPCR
jgi:hypothetical protein